MTLQTDIGAYIAGRFQNIVAAVAAGAGDAVEMDGVFVDGRSYHSAKLIVAFEAVLAAAATLSIAANLQHADDLAGTNAEDFGPAFANAIVATGAGGGSTERGVVELNVNLIGDLVSSNVAVFRGFLQGQATPDLSAGSVDTADIAMVLVLGGADVLPAV